jgi:hypothetical protein
MKYKISDLVKIRGGVMKIGIDWAVKGRDITVETPVSYTETGELILGRPVIANISSKENVDEDCCEIEFSGDMRKLVR